MTNALYRYIPGVAREQEPSLQASQPPQGRPMLGKKARSDASLGSSRGYNQSCSSGLVLQEIKEESGATESPSSSHHDETSTSLRRDRDAAKAAAMMEALNHGSDHSISNTRHLRPSLMNKAHSVAALSGSSSRINFSEPFSEPISGSPLPRNMDKTHLSAPPASPPSSGGGSGLTMKNHRKRLQQQRSVQQLMGNLGSPPLLVSGKGVNDSSAGARPSLKSFRASSEAILDTLHREQSKRMRDSSKRLDGHSSLSILNLERFDRDAFTDNGSINPSSTFHVRPKLEQALERRKLQLQQQRAMATSMSTLGDTFGGVGGDDGATDGNDTRDDDLPFEFEPDEEELERRKSVKAASLAKSSDHRSQQQQEPFEDEDPFTSACEVAKQQYYQDFANSNIPDRTSKFPQFDVSEIHQGFLLGKGSFAQVIEVKGFCLKPTAIVTAKNNNSKNKNKASCPPRNNSKDLNGSWNFTTSMQFKRQAMAAELMDNASDLHDDITSDENSNSHSHSNLNGSFLLKRIEMTGETTLMDHEETSIKEQALPEEDDEDQDQVAFQSFGYQDITDDDMDLGDLSEEEDDDDDDDDDDVNDDEDDKDKQDEVTGKHVALTEKELSNRSLFKSVHEKRKNNVANRSNNGSVRDAESSRRFIARNCYRAKEGQPNQSVARYALKQLKRKITEDPHSLLQGVADMATETRVLSSLTDHPNLVKLRGIARGSEMPFRQDYFILLDRLYDTLESRIRKWKVQEKKLSGISGIARDMRQIKRKQLWMDRVSFAFDLSSALAYLHSKYVIHRDLKPDNIGFDIRGDIKIFDFGLAKELPTLNNGAHNLFHFTAMCGSPRYMAPEVGMEEPYNELCDVYSFGVLFWEMMALTKPYDKLDMVGLIEDVWRNDARAKRPSPSLQQTGKFICGRGVKGMLRRRKERKLLKQSMQPDVGSPASLQFLLDSCWCFDLERRPSMAQVENQLREELMAFRTRHDEVEHSRIRMTHAKSQSSTHLEGINLSAAGGTESTLIPAQ